MFLLDLSLEIFDLIFDNLRVAEACLVYHAHSLLNDIGMSWIAHLENSLLLDTKDAIVSVQVRHNEVEDVSACTFLQSLRQLEETNTKTDWQPLFVNHLLLHDALQFSLICVHLLIISLFKEYLSRILVQFDSHNILVSLLQSFLYIVLILAQSYMLIVSLA